MQWFIYSHCSIYQWIDLLTHSCATSESATMTFLMQWFTHFHRFTHQWIWSNIHVQLVSLLQWRAQSWSLQWASQSVSLLQWYCQCNDLSSHHSTHQWINSFTRSCATSESATMTLHQCNDLSSHHSIYQWIDLLTHSYATSESASMTLLPCIVSLLQ